MTRQPQTHIPTAKRLLNQIGSHFAFSRQTFLAFGVPAFASALIFESTRLPDPLWIRLLFALIGYLATVGVLVFARRYFPDRWSPSRPGLVMSLFALAGIIRGLVLTFLSYFTVGISLDQVLYRILGGPIFTTVMLTLCTVLVANNLRHREALRELASRRHQLEIRLAGDRVKAELQREELISKVREILAPAIAKVQENLSSDSVQKSIGSLTKTVEKVIRPLSKSVASEKDILETADPITFFREKSPLPKTIRLGEFLLPFFGALVAGATIIPSAFWIEEPLHASFMVILAFAQVFLLVGLVSLVTRRLSVPTRFAIVLVPIIYGLSVSPFIWISPVFGFQTSRVQIYSFMLYVAFMGLTFFAGQIRQLQREATLKRFAKVNLQIERLNSWLRQQLWLNRRRTAAVLHGPVQAALYAAAIKLSQAEKVSDELIGEVEKDIQAAILQLENPGSFKPENLNQTLDQIIDIWGDAAEIRLNFPEALREKVSKQPLAAEAVVEVIREFVTNAIKHGSAKNVEIALRESSEQILEVKVIDDGEGPKEDSKSGFGSKLLDELTLGWKLERVGDTTLASAEIVLEGDNL